MPEEQWYYSLDVNSHIGPVTQEQLLALSDKGEVTFDTLIWNPNQHDWRPMREFYQFNRDLSLLKPPSLSKDDSFSIAEKALFDPNKPMFESVEEKGIKVGWMYFYIYVRLPLGILSLTIYTIYSLLKGGLVNCLLTCGIMVPMIGMI